MTKCTWCQEPVRYPVYPWDNFCSLGCLTGLKNRQRKQLREILLFLGDDPPPEMMGYEPPPEILLKMYMAYQYNELPLDLTPSDWEPLPGLMELLSPLPTGEEYLAALFESGGEKAWEGGLDAGTVIPGSAYFEGGCQLVREYIDRDPDLGYSIITDGAGGMRVVWENDTLLVVRKDRNRQ